MSRICEKATKWRAEITTSKTRIFKRNKYNKIPIMQHTTREQLAYTVRDKAGRLIYVEERVCRIHSRIFFFKTVLCKFLSLLNCPVNFQWRMKLHDSKNNIVLDNIHHWTANESDEILFGAEHENLFESPVRLAFLMCALCVQVSGARQADKKPEWAPRFE